MVFDFVRKLLNIPNGHTVTYGASHKDIVENGVEAIKAVLQGDNSAEKESLLFCLDMYLDPWYGYNLPYANEIFDLLQYVVIEPNAKEVKEEALHLLQYSEGLPYVILEQNLDKIEAELIGEVQYVIDRGKE